MLVRRHRPIAGAALLAAALAALAARASGGPPAAPRDSAGGGGSSSFTFEWRKGMVFVSVRVDGSRPLAFVLDSGSTRTLIDRGLAASLQLKTSGAGSLQGAGAGRIAIEFIRDATLTLPGVESTGHELSTADLQPLEKSLGVRVDGILGYAIFSRFVIAIDFEKRRLTFTLPEAFHPREPAAAIPIELRDRWPFVKAELVLPGPVAVQDSFLIDTGSSDEVDHPLVMQLQSRAPTQSGVGLGVPVQGATARATSFRLGPHTLGALTVSCCGASEATSRLIGSEVLRRFTITFDYPSSRIFLVPNASFAKPFP